MVARLDVQIDVAPQFVNLIDQALLVSAVESAVRVGIAARASAAMERMALVSVRVTDDEEMRRLNQEYRGVDAPTDVLSFSFLAEAQAPEIRMPPDWPVELGEIILSWPYAARQAVELEHPVATEIAWLAIHGSLQLLGYSHAADDEAEHMEALERQALGGIGIVVE